MIRWLLPLFMLFTVPSRAQWSIDGLAIDESTGQPPNPDSIAIICGETKVPVDSGGGFHLSLNHEGPVIFGIVSPVYHSEPVNLTLDSTTFTPFVSFKLHRRSKKQGTLTTTGVPGHWRVTGFIVDGLTELPVPAATLAIDGNPVPVDDKGSFSCQAVLSAPHRLVANAKGYSTGTFPLVLPVDEPEPLLMVRLSRDKAAPLYREIVVSASREPLHNTARLGLSSLGRKELIRTPGGLSDPLRTVQSLPGVTTQNDLSARPVVRGGDVLETRVSLDNIPLLQPYHFGGAKSVFNPFSVDKLTLYRGDPPASIHNALSGVMAVDTRSPARADSLAVDADFNLLQYSAFAAIPLLKDRLGLTLFSQSSYVDFAFKQLFSLAMMGEEGSYAENLKRFIQLPDYRDIGAGLGLVLSPRSRLSIQDMVCIDRFHFVTADSIYRYRLRYADGYTDSMTETVSWENFDNPKYGGYDYYQSHYDSVTGLYLQPESVVLTSRDFVADTEMAFRQTYNTLWGQWEYLPGRDHVFKTVAAWQQRRWDVDFPGTFNIDYVGESVSQVYDVSLDQIHAGQHWIYSGIRNHVLHAGLQLDWTRHSYNVHMLRYLHDLLVRGNTNFDNTWGPVTGDSGFTSISRTLLSTGAFNLVSESWMVNLMERLFIRYNGVNQYWNSGLFVSDAWNVGPNLAINGGVRLEYSQLDESLLLSPRLSARFSAGKKDEFMAAVSRLTQNDYDFAKIALSEKLGPEQVWQFSAGWAHEFKPWLKQELSVYHKQYANLAVETFESYEQYIGDTLDFVRHYVLNYTRIVDDKGYSNYNDSLQALVLDMVAYLAAFDTASFNRLFHEARLQSANYGTRYTNRGTGFAQGVEYQLRFDPADWWSGWFNVALSRSRRTRAPGTLSHPFDWDRPLSVSLINQYRLPRAYEIGVKFRYQSGLPYTPVSFSPEFSVGKTNSARYAPYVRFDLRISKAFGVFGHRALWYTELWNAFNTPNYLLRDSESGEILSTDFNLPIPMLFTGFELHW